MVSQLWSGGFCFQVTNPASEGWAVAGVHRRELSPNAARSPQGRCGSTVLGAWYPKTDRHQLLGSCIYADAAMDRTVFGYHLDLIRKPRMCEKIGAVGHGRTRWTWVARAQKATGSERPYLWSHAILMDPRREICSQPEGRLW